MIADGDSGLLVMTNNIMLVAIKMVVSGNDDSYDDGGSNGEWEEALFFPTMSSNVRIKGGETRYSSLGSRKRW